MTRRRRRYGSLAAAVATVVRLVALAPAAAADERGEPFLTNQGVALPGNAWIAGDVTVAGEIPKRGVADVALDDVSLLGRWEPVPRLALFTELRLADVVGVIEHEGVSTADIQFTIERLWWELLLSPSFTLRAGKQFTPFGVWNQIHRAPFTWTSEEPAVADLLFPRHATGLSLLGRTSWRGWSFDGTMYGPTQDELRVPGGGDEEEGWLLGSRVVAGHAIGSAYAAVGFNAAAFRSYDVREWNTAAGLDLDLDAGGHQVTGELTFRIPSGGGHAVYGCYLQDAVPLSPAVPDLYGVVRVEVFQPRTGAAAVGGLVGLFWRPMPNLILRTDYLFANRTLERLTPGLHGSITLLF